jgi:hypothetical protein
MSISLHIEFTNVNSSHGEGSKTGIGEYYVRIPLGVDVHYALGWLIDTLVENDNHRINYLTVAGVGAILRMAGIGETRLTAFTRAIVDPHHQPFAMVSGPGSEEELRIFKRAFSAPWRLFMDNNKDLAHDIAASVPQHHLHRHHRRRIEHITGNHSRIRRI